MVAKLLRAKPAKLCLLATMVLAAAASHAGESNSATKATPRGWPHYLHPVTGKPYTQSELDRLKYLRLKFPDNPLLPKALSAAEVAEIKEQAAGRKELARKMTAGTATRDEIDHYYAFLDQFTRARIQLADFVLGEPHWDEKIRERYRRVRDTSLKHLKAVSDRRARSIVLFEQRQGAAPPTPPLAVISPRELEVTQGALAQFEAEPGSVEVKSLTWYLPAGEPSSNPAVQVPTKSLPPGLHEVLLEAIGNGSRSIDKAFLKVLSAPKPALDLAVENVGVAQFPSIAKGAEGKVQFQVMVRNLGLEPVSGAKVLFQPDKLTVIQIADLSLEGGESRWVWSEGYEPAQIFDHEISIRIEPPDILADANLENNLVSLNLPTPAGESDIQWVDGVAPQGPPFTNVPFPLPEQSIADMVTQVVPLPIDLGPVEGFADLHLHQMSNLGYDGRLIWGSHDGGSESAAVPECDGTSHALCWLPSLIAGGLHEAEAGSHAGLAASTWLPTLFGGPPSLCASPLWTGGENAVTKGWHSNTVSRAFKHWPVWRTVTHQQAYREWLELAHGQGLNLIVMSAVNFSLVCSLMPTVNGFEGPHPLDDAIPGLTGTRAAVDTMIRNSGACNDMRNVRRQLRAAWEFDAAHDWYEIAFTPGQAAQIIQEGKLAVVLSIEASDLFDNPGTVDQMRERLDYFVNVLGVRSIQPVHELDNAFGGTSYFDFTFSLAQALRNHIDLSDGILSGGAQAAADIFAGDLEGIVRDPVTGDNTQELTALGRQLLLDAMAQGLLFDIAHLDRTGSNQAYNIAREQNYYPLFASHVRYQDLLGGSDVPFNDHLAKNFQTIQEVKELGGMIGLRTAKNRVRSYTRGGPSGTGVENNCAGSVRDFAQSYNYGAIGMGIPQAFASDMNGFIQQMRPRFFEPGHPKYDERRWACNEGVNNATQGLYVALQGVRADNGTGTDFDLTGFGHIGQIGDLLADLRDNLGVETTGLEESAEAFVNMWVRAQNSFLRGPGSRCIDRTGIDPAAAVAGPTNPGCP